LLAELDHPLYRVPPVMEAACESVAFARPLWLVTPSAGNCREIGAGLIGMGIYHPLFNSASLVLCDPWTGQIGRRDHYCWSSERSAEFEQQELEFDCNGQPLFHYCEVEQGDEQDELIEGGYGLVEYPHKQAPPMPFIPAPSGEH
jgi:hypothetical protein